MIVFQCNRGSVVRMDDPGAQCTIGFVGVPDDPVSYSPTRAIITRLLVSQQTNVQFLHTLGAAIYIYVFGDRVGMLALSGIGFNAACESPVGPGQLGIVQTLAWYQRNRVAMTGRPVRVAVGTKVFEGFVVSGSWDTIEPESGLTQWGVQMAILPDFIPLTPEQLPPPGPYFGPDQPEQLPTVPSIDFGPDQPEGVPPPVPDEVIPPPIPDLTDNADNPNANPPTLLEGI